MENVKNRIQADTTTRNTFVVDIQKCPHAPWQGTVRRQDMPAAQAFGSILELLRHIDSMHARQPGESKV